jgi:hypothetical protein
MTSPSNISAATPDLACIIEGSKPVAINVAQTALSAVPPTAEYGGVVKCPMASLDDGLPRHHHQDFAYDDAPLRY